MTPGRALRRAALAAGLITLAACATREAPPPPVGGLALTPVGYDALAGWSADRVSAALPAFRRSCAAFLGRPETAPLDGRVAGDFGTVGEWAPLCRQASSLPDGDDAAARKFFASGFTPLLASSGGAEDGLFTGYFEIVLDGARQQGGAYQTPLYRRPPDPTRYGRAEIEDGALAGQGLELLWVDDPIAAFFLQIQGSGIVRLRDGTMVRLGYAGGNGHSYVAVGRLLADRDEIPRAAVTMATIVAWMTVHPQAGAALRRENPSYVFFRELPGDGPIGAEGSVLTAGRSLAVDRAYVPLGVPLWLDAVQRYGTGEIHRLVVAQDTGGAVKGGVRGDLFWGSGDEAGAQAGVMNARGRYYLLLPRAVAARRARLLAAD